MEKIEIRGIPFDNVTMAEALELIDGRLSSGLTTEVFTPNAEIVQACIEDDEYLRTVASADVILPDGIGVIKAAKILGTPLKEKVPGVELGEELLKKYADGTHSFFILGGKPSVAEEAAARMSEKYGTRFAGCRDGYFKKDGDENEEVIKEIDASGADCLFVCLGFPVQEKWLAANLPKFANVKLAAALGGSVDVWAGNTRRAPKIFIKTGCEWLWRLIKQPYRIGRMMKLPKFYLGMKKYKKNKDKEANK